MEVEANNQVIENPPFDLPTELMIHLFKFLDWHSFINMVKVDLSYFIYVEELSHQMCYVPNEKLKEYFYPHNKETRETARVFREVIPFIKKLSFDVPLKPKSYRFLNQFHNLNTLIISNASGELVLLNKQHLKKLVIEGHRLYYASVHLHHPMNMLQVLTLENIRLKGADLNALRHSPLKVLNCRGVNIFQSTEEGIVQVLNDLTELKELEMCNCTCLQQAFFSRKINPKTLDRLFFNINHTLDYTHIDKHHIQKAQVTYIAFIARHEIEEMINILQKLCHRNETINITLIKGNIWQFNEKEISNFLDLIETIEADFMNYDITIPKWNDERIFPGFTTK